MAWIESHTVLMRHRKLAELARALRIRRSYAMGHLHALWHAALEQQEDGNLSSWSDEFIAEQSDFPGDAPQYVRLLQEHGFLDERLLHDWLDYAGRFLIAKYSTSNKQRLLDIWELHGREYGANGKRPVSDKKANLPNQPNQPDQPNTSAADAACVTVEEIYQAYPRKVGKEAALKAITKAAKRVDRPDPLVWLMRKTKAYADERRKIVTADPTKKKYTPHPATWFNEGRYDDEPDVEFPVDGSISDTEAMDEIAKLGEPCQS